MRVLKLQERGAIAISEQDFAALRASEILRSLVDAAVLKIAIGRYGCMLEAGPYVGAVEVSPDLTVRVMEKAPGVVENLFQLAYATEYRLLRARAAYTNTKASDPALWLREATWAAFLDATDAYLEGGIERHYVAKVRVSGHPRGRILLKPTFQQLLSRGHRGKLYCRRHELSRDTFLNRLVKLGLLVVSQGFSNEGTIRAFNERAEYLLYHFGDVLTDRQLFARVVLGHPLVGTTLPESELVRFAIAVISEVVLLPLEEPMITLPFATFLSLERLFERAVYETVASVTGRLSGWRASRYSLPDGPSYLFWDSEIMQARPDVVVDVKGHCRLLMDAKYRTFSDLPHADVYQLLAHCRAFGVSEGWLVGIHDGEQSIDRRLGRTRDGMFIRLIAAPPAQLKSVLDRAVREVIEAEPGNASMHSRRILQRAENPGR